MRKILLFTALILISTFANLLQAQSCNECRYAIPVFDSVTVVKNVKFAEGVNSDDQNQELFMDVYMPFGDTETARPIFIFAFGGAFIQGTRDDEPIVDACKRFARSGYVAVSIDYRKLNTDNILSLIGKYSPNGIKTRTFFMPMQEMRASIQYMKAHFAEMGNEWKLDTNRIFVSGVSSGAITALNVAYCNTPEELAQMGDISSIDDLGGFYSTSGPHKTYTWKPTAVISIAGALSSLDWLNPGEPPVISVQGDQDDVVPYKYGDLAETVFPGASSFVSLPLYGSYLVDSVAKERNVCTHLYTIPGAKHNVSDINPIYFEYIFHEFLPRLKGLIEGKSFCTQGIIDAVIQQAPIAWAEPGQQVELNLNLSGSETNPSVLWCKTAPCGFVSTNQNINITANPTEYYIAMASNANYMANDFVTVTNDSSTIVPTSRAIKIWEDLVVYPNPAKDQIVVSTDLEKNLKISLISLTGQTVLEVNEYQPGSSLSLSSLPQGLYTLRLRGVQQEGFVKIMIK